MTTTANLSPPSLGARIYHLSYVTAAVEKVGAIYEAVTKPVRNRDGVLKNTLEGVENKALKAVHAVEPIVQPIDQMAGNAMEKVDQAYKRGQTYVSDTATSLKSRVETTVTSVKERVQNGAVAVQNSRLVRAAVYPVATSIELTLSAGEKTVEFLLPPGDDDSDDESDVELDQDDDVDEENEKKTLPLSPAKSGYVARVGNLSRKVKERVYKRALAKIRRAQLRSQEALDKLKFNVDLIKYAEENFGGPGKLISKGIKSSEAVFQAVIYPGEEGEDDSLKSPLSGTVDDDEITKKAVFHAKVLSRKVRGGFRAVSNFAAYLPSGVHAVTDHLKEITHYPAELFEFMKKFEMSEVVSPQMASRISEVVDFLKDISSYVGQSVTWLIKTKRDRHGDEDTASQPGLFTSRATWPSLKKANDVQPLRGPFGDGREDEEIEEEEEENKENDEYGNEEWDD